MATPTKRDNDQGHQQGGDGQDQTPGKRPAPNLRFRAIRGSAVRNRAARGSQPVIGQPVEELEDSGISARPVGVRGRASIGMS